MMRKQAGIDLISSSVKFYRALLFTYPPEFQQEYGSHMVQVFRDCCLRTFHQSGNYGILKLWAITFIDLLSSALAEHLQKEHEMTKSMFVKLSGWAFVVGSFVFISILNGSLVSVVISSILLAIGMLGLRARYGGIVGSFGRNILLVGVAGTVLASIAVPIFRDNESLFLLPYAGPAVLLTSLTIFGLVALARKPLPHVNWLPFLAGIWFPALYFSMLFITVMNNGALPNGDIYWTIASTIMPLQFLALCILGVILQGDTLEEITTPT